MPTTLIEIDGQEWVMEMINNIILEVLATLAEQEHENIVNRTREGLNATKKRGTKLGRKCIENEKIQEVKDLMNNGLSVSGACRKAGISRAVYYKYAC